MYYSTIIYRHKLVMTATIQMLYSVKCRPKLFSTFAFLMETEVVTKSIMKIIIYL